MDPNENRRCFARAWRDSAKRRELNRALAAWLKAGGFAPAVALTASKVRMCTARDMWAYSVDGRYFGRGAQNYDCACEGCSVYATIGAGSRAAALYNFAPQCRCGR
jgi:hypothetical protein